jgi:hypothetical protein
MAGYYKTYDAPSGYSTELIADDQGRMLGFASATIYHPERPLFQDLEFHGTATVADATSTQWEIPNAHVYATGTYDPAVGVVTVPGATGRVSGSFDPQGTVTFSVSKPPALQFFPDNLKSARVLDNSRRPIALADIAGRYGARTPTFCLPRGGSCTIGELVAQYTLESSGRIHGTIANATDFTVCTIEGTAELVDGRHRLLRARVTRTGASCPAGEAVFLGTVTRDVAPGGSIGITWFYTDAAGRVQRSVHGGLPPPESPSFAIAAAMRTWLRTQAVYTLTDSVSADATHTSKVSVTPLSPASAPTLSPAPLERTLVAESWTRQGVAAAVRQFQHVFYYSQQPLTYLGVAFAENAEPVKPDTVTPLPETATIGQSGFLYILPTVSVDGTTTSGHAGWLLEPDGLETQTAWLCQYIASRSTSLSADLLEYDKRCLKIDPAGNIRGFRTDYVAVTTKAHFGFR